MLRQYFALLLTLLLARAGAQNNLIVLTEKGDLFWLFINDQPVNDSAQSVVTAKKIMDDSCTVKMAFANREKKNFTGTAFLTEAGKNVSKKEFTYSLTEDKEIRKLKFISVNSILSDTSVKSQSPEKKIESVFIDKEKREAQQDRLAEKYPAPQKCVAPITDTLLKTNLKLLRDNHIEMNRLKDGKWFVSHNCINAKQVVLLMGVFDRRDSKVKIAEFCFDYMENHRDFLQVLDGVPYEAEKEELKNFYNKHIEK